MSLRHQPVRTCIGCRGRDDQANLVRWSAVNHSGVTVAEVDLRRRLMGRGAWLHPRPSCVELALKRKAFNRAFRGAVDTRGIEHWLHTLQEVSSSKPPACTPSSLKAGQKTDGNPMSTQR